MTVPRPVHERFVADRAAVSAVEFAFVFPVLMILLLGGLQLVKYVDAARKVQRIASSVSEMISQATPPSGSTTALVTTTDLHFAYDSQMVLFPYVMVDARRQGILWWQDIEIDMAGVKFVQIGTNCPNPADLSACYVPQMMWTTTYGSHVRACLPPPTAAANTAGTNSTMLPKGVFGPGSLIVVDVYFTFRPTFAASLLPPITIVRSAYVSPRYASLIRLDTTSNDSSAIACPGF